MNKFTMAMFATLLLSQLPQALAGQEGGGAGGFCIKDKCVTLAEAGVRVGDTSGKWIIPAKVQLELLKITDSLPFGGANILKYAKGKTDRWPDTDAVFYKVDSVSSSLMKKVKNDYLKILKETGTSEKANSLEIFAISSRETTLLLAPFFKLNERQQALVLIHEAIVRERKINYRLALQFDGEFLDYEANKEDPTYSPIGFYRTLSWVLNRGSHQIYPIIFYLEKKLGRNLVKSDFFDPRQQLRNSEIVPEYLEIFQGARFKFASTNYNGVDYYDFPALWDTCQNPSTPKGEMVRYTLYQETIYFSTCPKNLTNRGSAVTSYYIEIFNQVPMLGEI